MSRHTGEPTGALTRDSAKPVTRPVAGSTSATVGSRSSFELKILNEEADQATHSLCQKIAKFFSTHEASRADADPLPLEAPDVRYCQDVINSQGLCRGRMSPQDTRY